MTPEFVQQLLDRYISEELSQEEFLALWPTVSAGEYRKQWEEKIDELLRQGGFEELASPQQQRLVLASILYEPAAAAPLRRIGNRKTWWAAASVLLMLAVGGYFLFLSKERPQDSARQMIVPNDLPPGREGAILTLADGEQLVLDSMRSGVIASENGAQVMLKNNTVSYVPSGATNDDLTYNTLSTPNGRIFHIRLPDGTVVWLNAGSSVRYPTRFSKERKVYITGEAYLEVAKDRNRPFLVDVNGKMEVQVLGTSFNVNAYTNESGIRTTLLEGSIRVLKDKEPGLLLRPGQQAEADSNGLRLAVNPDLKVTVAWKEGYFLFNATPVTEILRQFARWYDLELVYQQAPPAFSLSGAIRRDFTLTEALMTLEKMGLRYRVEGRKLVVMSSSS